MALHAPKAAFILTVKVTIDPAKIDDFLSHFHKIYDLVVAEPECLYFVFGQSPSQPGVFHWTEGWAKDAEWVMNVRMSSPPRIFSERKSKI